MTLSFLISPLWLGYFLHQRMCELYLDNIAASIQGRPFPIHIISVADYQNVYFCKRNRDSLHCIDII